MGAGMRYQPQGRFALESSNPLSRGLVLASLCGVNRAYEATGKTVTATGTKQVPAPDGLAAGFGATVGAGTTDKVVTRLATGVTARSYYFRARRNGAGGGSLGRLFDKTNGTTGQFLYWYGASSLLAYSYYAGGVERAVQIPNTGVAAAIGALFDVLVTHAISGTTHTVNVWVNGVLTITDSVVAASNDAAGTALTIGNRASDNARTWDGLIEHAYVWDRILSDYDATALYANPWQLFQAPDEDDFVLAGSGATGASATTDGADTSASSGSVLIGGASNATDGADSFSTSGAVAIAGSSAANDGADAANASGAVLISGASAPADGQDARAASGSVAVSGSSSTTDGQDTATANGAVAVGGSSVTADGADSVSASGSVVTGVTGSGTTNDGADTSAASGAVSISGSGTKTDGADASAASGAVTVSGSAATNDGADASSASGTVATGVSGSSSVTDGADAASAIGKVAIAGSAAANNGADVSSGSGVASSTAPYVSPSRIVNFNGGTNRASFDGGTNRVAFDGGTNRVNF